MSHDIRRVLLEPASILILAVLLLAGGVALGALLDPFGDSAAGPPETLELGPPPLTPSPATPSPVSTASPISLPTQEPTVVVTEIPVPVVTRVPVLVEGDPESGEAEELLEEARQIYQAWVDYCEVLVSPEVDEAVETLEEAREMHQAWVDYLVAYPSVDPPDDGMTRDERLSRERRWVTEYDQILLLLQEASVGCSLPMSEGGVGLSSRRLGEGGEPALGLHRPPLLLKGHVAHRRLDAGVAEVDPEVVDLAAVLQEAHGVAVPEPVGVGVGHPRLGLPR